MASPPTLFDALFSAYGPQHWWPAKHAEEMMVGAILVQNTAWVQVTKVIAQLESQGALSLSVLRQIPEASLWAWLRPVGYFRVKTRRLKALAEFMQDYEDRPEVLFRLETDVLRYRLLQVHGIGKETADSIVCYAAKRPFFVVDAYTQRLFRRFGWVGEKATYDAVQALVHDTCPKDAAWLGELHALIVHHAKTHCRVRPLCGACPVHFCPAYESPLS